MDPNVTLRDLRAAVQELRAVDLTEELDYDVQVRVENVLERFADLDEWLLGGGFVPHEWARSTQLAAIQRELDVHPTWNPPTREEARERCSFTTLAGTTSWSERCVGEVMRGQR